MRSSNFDHLQPLSKELHRLGVLAERFFADDANTSLIKCRQFMEFMVKEVAARSGIYQPEERDTVNDLLRKLKSQGILAREVTDVLHTLRKLGNRAVHSHSGASSDALSALKLCFTLGVWYRRSFGQDTDYKSGPFVPPRDPQEENLQVKAELKQMAQRVRTAEAALSEADSTAEELTKTKQAAEELASRAQEESSVWEQSALELEASQAELSKQLAELQSRSEAKPLQHIKDLQRASQKAAENLNLDEADTRLLIDVQLLDMGWEADTKSLRHANGTRPEEGRNIAIAEWPTKTGPVDYAFFVGLKCVAVAEAKREEKDVPSVLGQAERYAASIELTPEQMYTGAPWVGDDGTSYQVPFVFATNGRPYLRQWLTKSGIWHRDLRQPINHPVALPQWFSPRDLLAKLSKDVDTSNAALALEGFSYAHLRPYQQDAIRAIEGAIQHGQRDVLISMATGTGKTRTCIALMYRLLKHKRFHRILFLVDRTSLGEQASDALDTTEMEGLLNFSQIYKVADLDEKRPGMEVQVHVATVQSLVAHINSEKEGVARLTPGTYDCIIVDEAHRGYTLDAELRENDISFRNLQDYQSTYRQALDYFDAVKIGLTATPALQTTSIFGHPVFHYGYRQAVVEGYLIDHVPPRRITTALSEAGIHFEGGEEVEIIDPRTGQIDLFELPDDAPLDYDLATFNKRVYSESFNRIVCRAIATEIPPDQPGKTLMYAARDSHADDIVRILTEELQAEYGTIAHGMVMKITGSVDDSQKLIRKFRNEPHPKYVVTVDLLTTGVDIPSICNLVFLRRVKSRILYDQMIGRATRLCPEINKEAFHIYDAVDVYAELQELSEMRPVVVNPNISLGQLVVDLENAETTEDRDWVANQMVVRMRHRAKRMDDEQQEEFARHTGSQPDDAVRAAAGMSGERLRSWLQEHPRAVEILERKPTPARGPQNGVMISTQEDELLHIREVFGEEITPEDYIEGFERYIRENMNTVPALIAATQRPRELTRKELTELATLLDDEHYSETMLRAAYGRARNADIAAHIIGFVRQAALGDPLVPYKTRVSNAITKIENSRNWTQKQREWLRRIGRALHEKPVADSSLLEQGAFAERGGFSTVSKAFDGELETILQEINEAVWTSSAA